MTAIHVPLPASPAATVPEAIARMTALGDHLAAGDGLAHFNRMYLCVTEHVQAALAARGFRNNDFVTCLDVVFANHYLRAVALSQTDPAAMPACWRVLHDRRWSSGVTALQYAVAGMNAHINHDLVLSLVSTWEQLELDPHDADVHDDFTRVNQLLAEVENGIRRSFEHGLLRRFDEAHGGVQHHVDVWSIAAARAAAWRDGHLLWRVRHHPRLAAHYEMWLDRAVAAAGECLLLPAGHHRHARPETDGCCGLQSFLAPAAQASAPAAPAAQQGLIRAQTRDT